MTTPSAPPEYQEEQVPTDTAEAPSSQVSPPVGKAPPYYSAPPGQAPASHAYPYYSPQGPQPPHAYPSATKGYPPPFGTQHLGTDFSKKSKSTTMVTIGNFSLFAIVLNLVLLGGFTFLGGFLVGLWVNGPSPSVYRGNVDTGQSQPTSVPLGSPQSQQMGQPSPQSAEIAQAAGDAAAGAISSIDPQNVPAFLAPLVNDIKSAAEKDAARKAREAMQHLLESPKHLPASPHSSIASPHPAGKAYAVQLGVFATQQNAQDLHKRMQSLNYKTHVKKSHSHNEGVAYHVHSGHYDTHAKATLAAAQFKQMSIPGATVVELHEEDRSGS